MTQSLETTNPYAAPRAKDLRNDSNDKLQEVKIFAISGRMGRVRYIVNFIGFYILSSIVIVALEPLLGRFSGYIGGGWCLVILVLLTIQRCHDFNMSGWLSVLLIIPFVNFIFWFVPGSDSANRWGNKTVPNTTLSTILAVILPLIFVAGIVASIVIPAYQAYSKLPNATQGR
jgi:uncharacterized membrane protein YhaH (DUF805 family)